MEPTPLVAGDPRLDEYQLPLLKSTEKFVLGTGGWREFDRKIVIDYLIATYVKIYKEDGGFPDRLLTENEAINGIPGMVEPLNMSTSSGYPTENFRPKGTFGKGWLFDNLGVDGLNDYRPKTYLREQLDVLYVAIRTGTYVGNYVKDVPKVEKRKIERVQAGETRLFNIFNCPNLILMKRVIGIFGAVQLKYKWRVNSTLGINIHGFDPTAMIENGLTIGTQFLEGDFTGWDGTFDEATMRLCIEVVDGFNNRLGLYRDAFTTRLGANTVMYSALYRFHIFGDIVYWIFTAMPSGSYATACWNTLGHNGRDRMLWRESVSEKILSAQIMLERHNVKQMFVYLPCEGTGDDPHAENEDLIKCLVSHIEMLSMKSMDAHVVNNNNGDDKLAMVDEAGALYFNAPTLRRLYEKKKIIYTPPEKPRDFSGYGDDNGIRELCDVQFLKSKFRRDFYYPQLVRMMMEPRTIENLPVWIRKGMSPEQACSDNIEDALRFASHHGEKYYNDMYEKFSEACDKAKTVQMPVISFDEMEHEFYLSCGVVRAMTTS